jgi:hypothetical protein
MIADIAVPAKLLTCEKCIHRWVILSDKLPRFCRNPQCRTRWWNREEPQRRSRADEIKLPAPRPRGRPRTRISFDYNEDS